MKYQDRSDERRYALGDARDALDLCQYTNDGDWQILAGLIAQVIGYVDGKWALGYDDWFAITRDAFVAADKLELAKMKSPRGAVAYDIAANAAWAAYIAIVWDTARVGPLSAPFWWIADMEPAEAVQHKLARNRALVRSM